MKEPKYLPREKPQKIRFSFRAPSKTVAVKIAKHCFNDPIISSMIVYMRAGRHCFGAYGILASGEKANSKVFFKKGKP